ncbi:MAG: YqeG family HAD IIIA-type phosphatase [Syntrophomonas sp.]
MLEILYPQIYVDSLKEIPLEYLKNTKIRAFIFDLDNTITEWNSNIITREITEWFLKIKEEGFKACILSNNGEQRVVEVAGSLGIPYIHRAQKPRVKAFKKALLLMGTDARETAVVGDQVFTDVLGGNRAGLYTILVVPINRREFMGTKISRAMEFFVLRRLKEQINKGQWPMHSS